MSGRLTYANAVSSLALFIALGGASYAALRLPANSVGTAQIRNHAVTWVKLGGDVRHGIRTGPQGPAGPPGPVGPEGPQGEPGTARAYGEVSSSNEMTNSKGDPTVTNPEAGRYCLTVPGTDPSEETIGVTLNVASSVNSAPVTEQPGDGTVCPIGTWEIATGTLSVAGSAVRFTNANEPFGFIVP